MATRTRKQQSKKAVKATAAVVSRPAAPELEVAARPAQELPAAVLGSAWIEGISLDGGQANVAVRLDVPAPTMQENPKYPWTPWNVDYLRKQLEKDLRRVAQTIANHQYVANLLESRATARAAAKVEKPAAVQTQQAAERPGVAQ
jgi:hypothetical protein